MSHPTEAMIEAWIRSNDPDPGPHSATAEHVRTCTACGKVETFLRSVITELDATPTAVPPAVHRFAESLAPRATVIRLSVLHNDPTPAYQTDAALVVLAARSAEHMPRFRPVAVLASPDGSTLLRLVHDATENVLRVTVAGLTGPAIIGIPAWNILTATDAHGTGKVPMPAPRETTEPIEASVFPALEEFVLSIDINAITVSPVLTDGRTPGVVCSLDDQTVTITIASGNSPRPVARIAVWRTDGQAAIHDVHSGPLHIRLTDPVTTLRVALFA
jgi:hypothetical protein